MKKTFIILLFIYPIIANGQVSDIDGNCYKTKSFGKQLWMIENLRVTRFNNGDTIPIIQDNQTWIELDMPGYCYFENQLKNKSKYGCLYNGFVVENDNNICPIGWHVPNEKDWKKLSRKDKHPISDSIYQGQRRGMHGNFYTFYNNVFFEAGGPWWCSSKSDAIAWDRFFDYVYLSYSDKTYSENGFAIRCVKD
jgi:hypothetical protein